MVVVFSDDFAGTQGSAWDSSKWSIMGSGTTTQRNYDQGNIYHASGNTFWGRATSLVSTGIAEVVLKFKRDANTNGAVFYGLAGTFSGSGVASTTLTSGVYVRQNTNGGDTKLAYRAGGSEITVATPFTAAANTDYYLRLRWEGTQAMARYWTAGSTEPTSWNQTLAVSGTIPNGPFFIARDSGSTTTPGSAYAGWHDDVTVSPVPIDASFNADAAAGTGLALVPTVSADTRFGVIVDLTTSTGSGQASDVVVQTLRTPTITSLRSQSVYNGTTVSDSASNVIGAGSIMASDFDLPDDFTNTGKQSATLNINVTSRAGTNTEYRVQRIVSEWSDGATTHSVSPDYVTFNVTSTGAKSIDVTSLVQRAGFYGLRISSASGDGDSYMFVPDGSTLTLRYAVVNESDSVDLETATGAGTAPEAIAVASMSTEIVLDAPGGSGAAYEVVVEASIDPNVTIDADIATGFGQSFDASVPVSTTADVDIATGSGDAYEVSVELHNNAILDLDTSTGTGRVLVPESVNDEPILASEDEDPYFVSTMRTIDSGDTWWRLNEAAGTQVHNRANPAAEWPGTSTGTYSGVTLGGFNAPEGRRSVYFNGAALIEENEPTATNIDEVFYSPNVLEFTFKTERGTQFIMGGADSSGVRGTGVSSPIEASEFWLVGGKINFRSYRLQDSANTPVTTTNITGFTNLADNEWHHVVINAGIANAARGSRAIEIYIDGKLEIRRFAGVAGTSANETTETSVVYFGSPDYIGGRPEYVDGRRLPVLPISQWFNGHMTEVVFRNSKALSQDAIWQQRDNVFAIDSIYTETASGSGEAEEVTVKGNKVRVMVLDFQTNAYLEISQTWPGVGPEPGKDVNGRVLNAPPYTAQFNFPALRTELADNTYGPEAYQFTTVPVRNNYTDPVTDNEVIVDLDVHVNLDDFDVIAIGNFPQNDADWARYTGLDEYSTAPFTPGRKQVENLIAQVRQKAIEGKRLFVNDPSSAVALGIIDRVEYVAQMRERVVNDVRTGSVANLYDAQAAKVDPWNANGGINADRYRDQHLNTRQRVRAQIDGLTTLPSYIVTDYVEQYNVDPMATPPANEAKVIESRTNGLFIGDEFYMNGASGPGLLDYFDSYDGTPTVDGRVNGWLAAPIANVKVGTVVTSFANKVWNLNKIEDNPYKDYAISIAIQPGDTWAGQTVQGKVYVNFTEAFTQNSVWKETATIQQIPAVIPDIYGGFESAEMRRWNFSTYRGTWTGTTVNPNQASGAGVIETNSGSGSVATTGSANATKKPNITNLVSFTWQSRYPLITVETLQMANRGVTWLASEVTQSGDAAFNATTVTGSGEAYEPVVEVQRSEEVTVFTARGTGESYDLADAIVKDASVIVGTATGTGDVYQLIESITLDAAKGSGQAYDPDSDLLNGLDVIRLVLPRHTIKLIMEER